MKKSFRLNRRAFLGGAGTTVALPLLEAMLPVGKTAFAQAQQPTRMIAYYVPCGIHMQTWTPAETGRNYTLTQTLQPLAELKDDFMVLTNLANRPAKPDGPGDHAAGTGSFITATHVKKTEGSDIQNGISLDQVAAQQIGQHTRLPSLELGMDGGGSSGGCDSGYSCAYARNISWSGPQTPMPKITSPRQAYDRLFAGIDNAETTQQREIRQQMNQSVLDYVMDDTRKLQQQLGANDRAKLEEYFTSIESLEQSLSRDSGGATCEFFERPGGNYDVTSKARIMADIMTLAFQCDITRVQSFMLANAGSNRSYDFIGVADGHHQISHHQGVQSNYDKLQIIDHWEIEQFAYLLQNLKNTTDPNGVSLLDSSMIFFSSEISDGNRHNHDNMPILLAGHANGYFNSGRHVRYSSERPVANLFMSMLDAMGTPVMSFGDDSTGLLENLHS